MPVEVNPAAVRWSNVQLPGPTSPYRLRRVFEEISSLPAIARRAAAGDHSNRGNEPGAGRCPSKHRHRRPHPMKDRTNEEGIDPATDKPTDDARRRGALESHGGGKHGAPQERNMMEEILEPERPQGSDSDIHSMRSHPAQTKSKPRPSVETREGEQGCSGDRRHDRRGLPRVRAGALAEDFFGVRCFIATKCRIMLR